MADIATRIVALAARATDDAVAAASSAIPLGEAGNCDGGNQYDDSDLGVRISAIFVILVGGLFGAMFPIISRNKSIMPPIVFFIAKYFGSGVIVATAFIHLLAPANEELGDPCLTGPITYYSWAEGIALMTVFALFFVELIVMRSGMFNGHKFHEHEGSDTDAATRTRSNGGLKETFNEIDDLTEPSFQKTPAQIRRKSSVATPARGIDHLSHQHDHHEVNPATDGGIANVANSGATAGVVSNEKDVAMLEDGHNHDVVHGSYDDYSAQMTAIFILEFGVIFHSIFIGLTLAVTQSGPSFNILYVVLVFHQTFEGMGLGTRLAITPWEKSAKGRLTPYLLAGGYSLATPIAIAIGLGVRYTFQPGSQTALIVTGVFDSISAGILLYTGLVELMAHEFMFSQTMQRAKTGVMLMAFAFMCLGAGLMALLGKWA